MPKVDDHNDWTLLVAMEFALSGKTVLRFSRALNTCDDEDYPIGVSYVKKDGARRYMHVKIDRYINSVA